MSVVDERGREGRREKKVPTECDPDPPPPRRAPHPAPTRDDTLQSEGVVRMRMLGDTDYSLCVFTRMNYIMNDETCFRFICTQVMVQCWYNVAYESRYVAYEAFL